MSGLIDFYFACNDALAYDIAVCLNAWCFEKDMSFNITKGQAFLRGYEEVRPITPAERAAMPTLARGAALRFLLTRAYDWLNTPKDALGEPARIRSNTCAGCAFTRACARSPNTA